MILARCNGEIMGLRARGGGIDGGAAEFASGGVQAEEQREAALDADFAIDGFDVGVEGVG